MEIGLKNKQTKDDLVVKSLFSIYTFIIVFEILLRAIIPDIDSIINLLKVTIGVILILYPILKYKNINFNYKYLQLIWWLFLMIFLLKVMEIKNITIVSEWLQNNNNINFFFIYLYFFMFLQIKDYISNNYILKKFKTINRLVIIISFILFFTNNYLGMVNYENMLAYAWVGTNKSRMMSIFGNPNHAGLYFVTMLFILDSWRVNTNKKFICIDNIILVICNLLTFSRTSVAIMMIYLTYRYLKVQGSGKNQKIKKIINKYKLLIILIVLLIIGGIIVQKYNVYFFSKGYLFESSRWERWRIGIDFIKEYPLIGIPFNIIPKGYSFKYGGLQFSDNMFIELGIYFGCLFMFIIGIVVIRMFLKSIINRDFYLFNKLQLIIISGMLSGIVHFSVFIYVYLIYFVFIDNNKGIGRGKDEAKDQKSNFTIKD